ncbi:hypothetical protein [Fusibacter ferrireducens]|uniref:Conjugal transfer protein n=1 Tax=Fusibacter ferrireducens TaxID=2785058 RepID=A0ABR9ZXE3_9FIRM|nr:hypothetical protein [Fusibacter ferrireducens]MBF4695125.1 hypothetical protein [Fusibacter ferrireducens]
MLILLSAVYVFVIKPYLFPGDLSEAIRTEAETEFNSILESVDEKDIVEADELPVTDSEVPVKSGNDSEPDKDVVHENNGSEESGEVSSLPNLPPKEQEVPPVAEQQENSVAENNPQSKEDVSKNESVPEKPVKTVSKEDAIIEKYTAAMGKIEVKAESLLQTLIGEAKYEYNNLSAAQKNDITVTGKLGSNYLSRADVLENIVDQAVEELLGKMKAELKSEGLGTDSVKKLRAAYETQKQNRRDELMNKALGYQP